MIITMLCVTIFVILVVWFLLPRVARLMIHTPTAISIFVCLSMVQLMAVFISMRCFFSSRRRHTRFDCDWGSDVCSSDLAIFAMFAVRSFCWLLFWDGNEMKIQSPMNLGDLGLRVTHINFFANGVRLWPSNPIYALGNHLRYPAGIDFFNALLLKANVDLIPGLVWVGLLASIATCYAFYRWGGAFAIAGFLFNGGLAGFQFLRNFKFVDYQDVNNIAWKSIPLTMFVTQRGLLYAIPVGLLLLWHWREKYFRRGTQHQSSSAKGQSNASAARTSDPLPFWVELSLYASMPLFHVHTFMALSIVLACFFVAGDPQIRGHTLTLLLSALIPATCFVSLISDQF